VKRVSRKQELPSRELAQPELAAKCQLMGWDIGCDTSEGQTRWVGDAEFVHLAHTFAVPLGALFPNAVRRTLRLNGSFFWQPITPARATSSARGERDTAARSRRMGRSIPPQTLAAAATSPSASF